jgi:N-(2-amino-2-carboxyethyl)-L-glutamate synthase
MPNDGIGLGLAEFCETDAQVRAPAQGILAAIGETPLVELRRYLEDHSLRIWAKLESSNPGGSAKARPAARMLQEAIAQGIIRAGDTVIESTSGNMGVGLAQACRYYGMRLICVVDSRTHDSNLRTLRAYGADVRIVSCPDEQTGDLLVARLKLVQHLVRITPGSFWPNQYANQSNPASHADGTMREIDEALGGNLDYLFVATSTAGTLCGCRDYLHQRRRATRIVAVDAVGSALFGGTRGVRELPGFGAGVETTLARSAEFDMLVRVSDRDCVGGCRRLVEREAIFAGGSSGGVAAALESVASGLPSGSRCALIFPDGGAGYLHTVYDDDWVRETLGCEPIDLTAPSDGATFHAVGAAAS